MRQIETEQIAAQETRHSTIDIASTSKLPPENVPEGCNSKRRLSNIVRLRMSRVEETVSKIRHSFAFQFTVIFLFSQHSQAVLPQHVLKIHYLIALLAWQNVRSSWTKASYWSSSDQPMLMLLSRQHQVQCCRDAIPRTL